MYGFYKADPMPELLPKWKVESPYHCINWTFRPRKGEDGAIYMDDTYFAQPTISIKVTEENADKFRLLFDTREMRDFGMCFPKDYDPEDYVHAACDSGGITRKHYFLKKSAKRSVLRMILNAEDDLASLKRTIAWKEAEIKRLYENLDEKPIDDEIGYEVYFEDLKDDEPLLKNGGFKSRSAALKAAVIDRDGEGFYGASIRLVP